MCITKRNTYIITRDINSKFREKTYKQKVKKEINRINNLNNNNNIINILITNY